MKVKILAELEKQTRQFSMNQLDFFQATNIAEFFSLSRNTASQYLNELVAEELLIKVNSRPVLFFHKDSLQVRCGQFIEIQGVYDSMEEFTDLMNQFLQPYDHFTDLIGSKGSLAQLIEKGSSAIKYPNGGLPLLLLGATGVGKSHIAKKIFDYGKSEGIYNESSRFVSINCSEYADNPEFFLTHLFGHKKGAYTGADQERVGLVELADQGVLFLDEIHCLKPESQEKLYHFMDNGEYRIVGDNDTIRQANVQFIFATSESPDVHLLRPFLRRIPITVNVPSLSQRPENEKRELLYHLFAKESQQIGLEIMLTNNLLQIIMNYNFLGNIGELSNCIKVCTATAFSRQSKEDKQAQKLVVEINHLPDYMIKESASNGSLYTLDEIALLHLADLKNSNEKNQRLHQFNQALINLTDADYASQTAAFLASLDCLLEEIIYEEQEQDIKEILYTSFVHSVCKKLAQRYQFSLSNDDIIKFSKLIAQIVEDKDASEYFDKVNALKVQQLYDTMRMNDAQVFQIMNDISDAIKNELNEDLSKIGFIDLFLFVKRFEKHAEHRETRGIILCHGFSTASSLKNTANSMLDAQIFDAIDMPIDMSTADLTKLLLDYILSLNHVKNIIILVDMGSLEIIHKTIHLNQDINIAILNNVTIKLALDIGFKVKNNDSVLKILESVETTDYGTKYVYFENAKREEAILFTSSSDIETADKLCHLVEASFPKEIAVRLLPVDYKEIHHQGKRATVFSEYDVKYILGSSDPQIPEVNFLGIEELIQLQDKEKMNQVFGSYLSYEEQAQFAQNLLKNFSKDNLVENLTILNPDKIVSYVEKILFSLRERIDIPFESRIVVGLYIHISCLVERLLTDKYISNYEDIDIFQAKHGDFIRVIKDSFWKLEKDYCVNIPVSEIAYLYDYIHDYK
ncbi:sigma-54 dependent transcriptional regulator of gfr operon [Enterococcus sp. PF1-24]|uniref:sigma 54-interacting transcriptional regulator n=1 Tax=unclassified Enterococcus TaxID=2608891 RepID=UPI0024731716|nr:MULTISPECIES: sigma 54-interacting transcriptional regulator [unclassified Enterococcus]MDH6365409.1 sigma-54 dependent transcriptional regulator of gfr operon [Enterococcus sp. PFB1-1]MDH6402519.1 sigma-54 dependent transcriptional regulator of gfr operon [Enterococcus sp. PF1-24]